MGVLNRPSENKRFVIAFKKFAKEASKFSIPVQFCLFSLFAPNILSRIVNKKCLGFIICNSEIKLHPPLNS